MKTVMIKCQSTITSIRTICSFAMVMLCLISDTQLTLNAQSFTTWQAGASSDYYHNFVWAGGTNFACHCLAGNDQFKLTDPNSPSTVYYTATRPHQAGSWSGTAVIASGPNSTFTVDAQMSISNGANDQPPFNCFAPCSGAYYGDSPISITTELLRPPQNVSYSYNPNGSVTFTWTVTTDLPEPLYLLTYGYNGQFSNNISSKAVTSATIECPEIGPYSFWTRVNVFGGAISIPVVIDLPGPPNPTGKIQGNVSTLIGNAPVSGVTITAELQNPGQINNSACWPLIYTDVTDASGDYVIPFIYWGVSPNMAQFEVTPSLAGHGFSPGMTITTLQAGDFVKTLNFKDTTSFVISGTVYDFNDCGLDSVLLTATPGPVVPVHTRADGTYDLVVPQTGTFQVTANYVGTPLGTQGIVVTANTSGHDFNYNSTDTLHGFVGAGCNEYIGQATLEIQSVAGCVLETIQTNLSGYYDVVVPSRPIQVQVINYNPGSSGLDMSTVLNAIDDVHEIDLDSTTELNIIYRKPISMEFSGLPSPSCSAINYPVLNQAQPYAIAVLVWESPGVCLADTGYITIQDNVSTISTESTILDTVPVSNGVALYTLIPGEPALASPYVKTISFTAHVDNQTSSHTISTIVSGSRQRTATFTTGAPTSLPFLILRDPPGDLSKSFFSQDTTRSYSQSYSTLTSGGVRIWAKARIGVDIFSLKAWGEIQGAISVGGSAQTTTESLVQISSSLAVETSSDEDVVGPGGDLIMGAAVNFIYGLADVREFDINTCSIVKDTVLVFSPDTFATTFILTVDDIRNITIPGLELLANNPDTTEEARRRFRNEIQVWEQTLQLNEALKESALLDPIDNYTLSAAAGPVTLSTTGLASQTKSLEFKQYIQGDIAAEAGLEFGGSGGSLGVEVTIRGDFGQSTVATATIATTTGFTFDDNDNGIDVVTFDYAKDVIYGTPVFSEPLGQTSCPHEPGTQFVDLPSMTCAVPVKYVASGNSVEFILVLGNNSESDDQRTYHLDFVEQSNEFGALIYNGANPFSGTIPFTINAGATSNTTIRVERSPGSDFYSFEGLQFDFYPLCEPSQKRTIYLTAYFANTCSNITLSSPGSNWLVNDMMNDEIDITMSGYTLGPNVDTVKLLYSPAGTQSWLVSNIVIPGPNLLAPPQTFSWDVSDIPDGLYKIRLALVCDETINYSTRVQGRIDRSAPSVFGIEEPVDDLYHPGDEISVSFKEDVNCTQITSGNCYLRSLPQNELYAAQFICDGTEVHITPAEDLSEMFNQAFEVCIIHVEDLYANQRPDTVKWQFVISEPDSDEDGVSDTKDRCPGGNDFLDSDLDGLPDDCDCMPTVSGNGRLLSKAAMDFDGVNDWVTVNDVNSMIPTTTQAKTIEGWFYAKTASGFHTIVSAYTNPSADFWIGTNDNQLHIEVYGGGVQNSDVGEFALNTWTHFAVVFSAGQVLTYLNGELTATLPYSVNAMPTGFPVVIGSVQDPALSWPFHGTIDEIRFWNHARTVNQIVDKINHELEGNESGLVAYYPFNEGTPFGNNTDITAIEDQSVNSHSGTLSGFAKTGNASNWVNSTTEHLDIAYDLCVSCPDTVNAAMDFDVTDKISIPNNAALVPLSTSSMTFETWIYPRDTETSDFLLVSEGNVSIARSVIGIELFTNSYRVCPASLPAFEWSHLAVVFEPANVKVYINGVLEYASAMAHQTANAGDPIGLGASLSFNSNGTEGRFDDVRFWNYARTAEQIQAGLQHELTGNEPGLSAYYNFNQGIPGGTNTAITMVPDITGNGHTGTLIGFQQTGNISNWVTSPFNFSDGDADGLPDICDDCFAVKNLTLQNMVLDGTFNARETITLGTGNTFAPNADVFLRAPEVRVLNFIQPLPGVAITVAPDPCGD